MSLLTGTLRSAAYAGSVYMSAKEGFTNGYSMELVIAGSIGLCAGLEGIIHGYKAALFASKHTEVYRELAGKEIEKPSLAVRSALLLAGSYGFVKGAFFGSICSYLAYNGAGLLNRYL